MEYYQYFGLQMSKKSCWIDSCMMALFFPDRMNQYFSPFVQSINAPPHLQSIQQETLSVISSLRQEKKVSSINTLRSLLHNYASQRNDYNLLRAFERENLEGYVFYYLVEFLKMFQVPPLRMVQTFVTRDAHIIELEDCQGSTIQECINQYFSEWSLLTEPSYLIIEMVNSSLVPLEQVLVSNQSMKLQSMIVYNCNHFITYVRKNQEWHLYDDFRTLNKKPLQVIEFGDFYSVERCHFTYGKTNTFFFYIAI